MYMVTDVNRSHKYSGSGSAGEGKYSILRINVKQNTEETRKLIISDNCSIQGWMSQAEH